MCQESRINEAFIFGSWAQRYAGTAGGSQHDIDLMIIGTPDADVLDAAITSVGPQLRRDVQFLVISPATWADRDTDPFLAGVTAKPTVTVLERNR